MDVARISLELLEMRWDDYEDFVRIYDSTANPENYAKRILIFGSLRELGFLLNQKIIDVEQLYAMLDGGFGIIPMWNKFETIFMKHREIYEDPTRYRWFEHLINELNKERVKRGLASEINDVDGYWTK